jgi:hypothetical protein
METCLHTKEAPVSSEKSADKRTAFGQLTRALWLLFGTALLLLGCAGLGFNFALAVAYPPQSLVMLGRVFLSCFIPGYFAYGGLRIWRSKR